MKNRILRIAYDAKRITHNSTGLGNYGRTLINNLSTFFPENIYLLYTPDEGRADLRKQITLSERVKLILPTTKKKGIGKAIWRSLSIKKELALYKPDIFHGLSGELPFGLKKTSIKTIVTIHDLIFLRYPEYYKSIDRIIYTFKFKKACKDADKIIAISEMTKKDIISYFNIPENKIEVVYQSCDDSFKKPASEEKKEAVRSHYNLPKKYILYLGSIEERKNLLLVLKALKLIEQPYQLIAVGKKTDYATLIDKYIEENNLTEQVTILDKVPFNDLPAIYQMADLFVYPSKFEGFGIPIIEALYSGIPVIAATGSCLEEAGGPGSLYIAPNDEQQMARAIEQVYNDNKLREEMIAIGKKYVSRFDNEPLTNQTMEIYFNTLNS